MGFSRTLKSITLASIAAMVLVIALGCSAPASTASSASESEASSASSAQLSNSSSSTLTKEEAEGQGYQVFEGTVHVVNAEELIALQKVDIDPAVASSGGTYAVLVLDEDCNVVGMQADGSGETTRSASMLGIAEYTDYDTFVDEYGDLDLCQSLDGQHVAMAAKAANITFPSDVSLPIAEPKANSVVVLQD